VCQFFSRQMTKTPTESEDRGILDLSDDELRRRPGRPTVSKETFAGHRDSLVWLLSVGWGDIGWQLTNAITLEELRQAFEPLREHPSSNIIAPFLRSTSTSATAKEVRLLKKTHERAVEDLRAAQEKHDNLVRTSQVAEQAMNEANPNSPTNLQAALFAGWKDKNTALRELEAARARLKAIEIDLADKSASFSQHELLDFIMRKKYARNPLVLANAMAGLPDMTWEHSHARASKIKYPQWPTYDYKLFTQIKTIWQTHGSDSKVSLIEFFRQAVQRIPKTVMVTYEVTGERIKQQNPVRLELCGNFRFLRLAVDEVQKELPLDSGEVPFRILSRFRKNAAKPRTSQELVLIAQEKID
jgi:hypothetical protein